jgi:aminoglycoside/choline kinase family phosphotransferase
MPRNLMLSEPNPGVLDFQDAVYGPVTYDVTCLFKDAFLSWPEERVRGWLESYWQQAAALDIPVQADFEDFLRASDLMGVQRHLKVIGIFARICHRDGKPRYLADVPRFFAYIEAVIARRPELAELQALLASLRGGARHEGNDSGGRQGRAHAPADPDHAKPLVRAGGVPLIEYHLRALAAAGFTKS